VSAPAGGALEGRTALVTGAVGALGGAVARRFAHEGARVVVSDIDADATGALAAAIAEETGRETYPVAVDVSDQDAVEDAARRVTREFGVCDALVVNAGVLALGPATELTRRQWDLVVGVNLTGAFVTATVFGRHLLASGRPGTVVFCSSLFGVRGGAGNAAYSASKFGVLGLSQSMAGDLAPAGIRVNAVCPGQIDTVMLDSLFRVRAEEAGTTPEHERAEFCRRIPLGSLGTADDVAKAFVYLSSDASSYVTGQHLVLDGGWQVG
jgi:NAD(P)-dependent dehydrogenase (short-subunit alcohol dehydrogenase family)